MVTWRFYVSTSSSSLLLSPGLYTFLTLSLPLSLLVCEKGRFAERIGGEHGIENVLTMCERCVVYYLEDERGLCAVRAVLKATQGMSNSTAVMREEPSMRPKRISVEHEYGDSGCETWTYWEQTVRVGSRID